MDKTYHPDSLEKTCYENWEKLGFFAPMGKGTPYCIMIPPPNVTGSLHMGHAFQQTLMDILIRYHRMQGDNTLWQGGTDHAGIATQMIVDRQLSQKGIDRKILGREKFLKAVWEWKEESGGNISRQLRRMGASIDWHKERFTMDEGLSNAVQEVFIRLYDEGLIYKGTRLVNWDPILLTAVSDLEVESSEEAGKLWHIRYPLQKGAGYLVVATTRPETLLGDVAVAVHPEDPRFKHLIGQSVTLPLSNRLIPIIADEFVDPAFGSGCVKITPAHDFNDYFVAKRHHLAEINIFTIDAKLNNSDAVPLAYQGLDRFQAREKMLVDLEKLGLIEKTENHVSKIPRGDRSGAILEPRLTTQWFVNVKSLAKPAIDVVENEQIQFTPKHWEKTYFEWMHNIEDWCISRQLWWGHRIPAWYDEAGNIYVGRNEAEVCAKYKLKADLKLSQDEDVLDTWFSSALWPFSTLGWPEKTKDLETFYPTNVLITGFDIIFFWVARMIMFGLKFTGKIPFHTVYINGIIQDHEGQKMSKTKGNVLDPLDIVDGISLEDLVKKRTTGLMQPQLAPAIEKRTRAEYPKGIAAYGCDALRFTFAALATPSRYIRFDLDRVEGNRHFCNKLWNAARYVLMNTEGPDKAFEGEKQFSLADKWIQSQWQQVKRDIHEHLNTYRFDLAAQAIYEFTWYEFCDWYLELSKPALSASNTNENIMRGTRFTLIHVFEELLRVLHPFMPYITEALWQNIAPVADIKGPSIMIQPYPDVDATKISPDIENEVAWLKEVILGIRNIRGEMNIAPGKILPVLYVNPSKLDEMRLQNNQHLLSALAKIEVPKSLVGKRLPSATALVGEMELLIPLAGLIDKEAEIARLEKEIDKKNKDLMRVTTKLDNPQFKANAPKEVVIQEETLARELKLSIQTLEVKRKELMI